jgi:hypothetical protein
MTHNTTRTFLTESATASAQSCSELLVLGDGITRSAAAETGHLRKGAGLGEGRTLVGTHNYTSFRWHPAPPSVHVRVHDQRSIYPAPCRTNLEGFSSPAYGVSGPLAGTVTPEVGRAAHSERPGRCRCLAAGRSKLRGRPPRSETVTAGPSVVRRAGQSGDRERLLRAASWRSVRMAPCVCRFLKPDDRDGRRYCSRQVREGRGAHCKHIGAEKAPCTVLLRKWRS